MASTASNPEGHCEIVNTALDRVFANTADNDFCFYTTSSNQSIHFGTQIGATAPSALKVTLSNIEVNGDIAMTRMLNVNGFVITPKQSIGTMNNVTTTVTSVPALASTASNVTFSLSNGQSVYRFVNSNNGEVARVSELGQVLVNSNDSSNAPSYSWNGDSDTGMYHASNDTIGFTCGGSNVMSIGRSNVNVNGVFSPNTLINSNAMQIFFHGVPTLYIGTNNVTNNNNIVNGDTISRIVFPSAVTYNWTPTYTSNARLNIPVNGLYSITYSYPTPNGWSTTAAITLGTDDIPIDGRTLAISTIPFTNISQASTYGPHYASLSTTAYLNTSNTICFIFRNHNGQYTLGANMYFTASIALLHRTS